MLAIRLKPELEQRLAELAARTGRTKSFYARLAIERQIEDMEDYFLAEEVLRTYDPSENISLEELRAQYAVADRDHQAGKEAA